MIRSRAAASCRPALGVGQIVLRFCPWLALTLIALAALSGVSSVPAVWLTSRVVDDIAHHDGGGLVALLAVAAALLTGAATALAYAAAVPAAFLAARVEVETETQLARACASFPGTGFLDDAKMQDRLHLAQRGAHDAPPLATSSVAELISSVSGIGGYVVLLYNTWPLMLIALFAVAIPMSIIRRRMGRQALAVTESASASFRWRDYYAELFTSPSAARDMRLHGAQDLFVDRLGGHLRQALDQTSRQQVRTSLAQIGFTIANAAIAGLGSAVVAAAAARGDITVGDFVLFAAAVVAVQGRLSSLLATASHMQLSLGIFGHYLEFVRAAQDARAQRQAGSAAPRLQHGIEIRDLWFRYSDRDDWVLRGLNARFEAGQSYAIVGMNGAGKSTLIRLLLRYYEPVQGAILWDGIELSDLDAGSLRERISGVLQDFTTYELTVTDNITLGNPAFLGDRARAREAAELAGIRPTVERLPDGFDTMLSTRRTAADGHTGSTLSGGQWQRIALARAFMRPDVDLLLLDEPNAGLDPAAEHQLHSDLSGLRSNGIQLLISHRLSAVRDADQIIVIQDGRVAESGSHEELITAGGGYAQLFRLQARGYVARPAGSAA